MYFTSNAGGTFHIWRQRFPTGQPEQVTSGPEEEEGIAIAPNGQSLITSVGSSQSAVWMHDSSGERQVSVEGYSYEPKFSPDGQSLYYLKKALPGSGPTELLKVNLHSGRREVLLSGIAIQENPLPAYDISPDGREIVATGLDKTGKPRLWVVDTGRIAPPRQLPGIEGDLPFFGASNEVFFHFHAAGLASTFVSRVGTDGTGLRKITDEPITLLKGISPDRRWLLGTRFRADRADVVAFPIDGGISIPIFLPGGAPGDSPVVWSYDGTSIFMMLESSIGNTQKWAHIRRSTRPREDLPAHSTRWVSLTGANRESAGSSSDRIHRCCSRTNSGSVCVHPQNSSAQSLPHSVAVNTGTWRLSKNAVFMVKPLLPSCSLVWIRATALPLESMAKDPAGSGDAYKEDEGSSRISTEK